jgi:hypothetical protein
MLTATITTDTDGRLTADSTCTIEGRTVAVPERVPCCGRLAPSRITAAIQELGYTTASLGGPRYYGTLTQHDGYVTVAVVPA